jgi:hypothetical protein
MINKKNIHLSKSQLIDLICETVLEVSNINEAMEDAFNPEETKEFDEGNHYLNAVPDKGFEEFWVAFNAPEFIPSGKVKTVNPVIPVDGGDSGAIEPNAAYEVPDGTMVKNPAYDKFEKDYKTTRKQVIKDIEDEVDQAADDARDYYKSYYSKDNPDVYEKLLAKKFYGRDGYRNTELEKMSQDNAVDYIHDMLDKIADGGWSWTHNGDKGGTNIWYSCKELEKAYPTTSSCDAWGWVSNSKTGRYAYNINVYKFTNPTLSSWRHSMYSTTVHEIGHLITRFLIDLGIQAFPGAWTDDESIETSGIQSGNKSIKRDGDYPLNPWESYARIHQLRRIFDVKSNISAKAWANIFMDKVNSGDITFEMWNIDETKNKLKKECGKKLSYTQKETGNVVADANKIQEFLKSKGFNISTDGGFGNETAKAVLGYLQYPINSPDAKEQLRKEMLKKYQTFSDGIGGQAQGIIADLLYEKCKELKNTWIPPVTIELADSGKRVIITLSKQLIKQQYRNSTDPKFKEMKKTGEPVTFDNLWSILSDLRFNGRKYSDISALFAKFSFDNKNFTPSKGDSKDNVYIIIDFEKIEEVNDIFVKDNMEYEFDELGIRNDSTQT